MARLLSLWTVIAMMLAGCASVASGSTGSGPTVIDGVIFTASSPEGGAEIYRLDADGVPANLSNHEGADNWPEYSPDGSKILFQSRRNGAFDLFVMEADGSGLRQLTDDPDHDYVASWSPDGTEIYFGSWRVEAGDEARSVHFYVMNADGSGQRRFMRDSPGASGALAPSSDGTRFLFAKKISEDVAEIFVFVRATGEVRQLTFDGVSAGSPSWSPDGARFAYYSDRGDEGSSIIVIDADGSDRRTLIGEGFNWYPRWSADGGAIIYTAAADGAAQADLDIRAIRVEGNLSFVTIAGGPGKQSEGRFPPK